MNKHTPIAKAAKIKGGVHTDVRHDSAHKHVTGEAVYIDDIVEPSGMLHAGLGLSSVAHGRVKSLDLSAVRSAPGVIDVLTARDIPGDNQISPSGQNDDPLLADGVVLFHGQPIFCVLAETRDQARRAARLAKVEYDELPGVFDIWGLDPTEDKQVWPPLVLKRGEAGKAIKLLPDVSPDV